MAKLTYRSIDTMKESRDKNNLTQAQIQQHINLLATFDLTHITLDCGFDDDFQTDAYRQLWVDAVRATGKSIWWRPGYVTDTGDETIQELKDRAKVYPNSKPTWFLDGDIYDWHPESTPYKATFGWSGSGGADQTTLDTWNEYLQDMMDELDAIFQGQGKNNVDTKMVSFTQFNATASLDSTTVSKMGKVCYDSYPAKYKYDVPKNVAAVLHDIWYTHEVKWNVPIIISEWGYPNLYATTDEEQRATIRQVLYELSELDYFAGFNYWVGAGSDTAGGYTYILEGGSGNWTKRPAAYVLDAFFRDKNSRPRLAVI